LHSHASAAGSARAAGAAGWPRQRLPWRGVRAGRSRASEPRTAPVGSADLTPPPIPTPPGPRAGTGAG
jgi:hypothetical protein